MFLIFIRSELTPYDGSQMSGVPASARLILYSVNHKHAPQCSGGVLHINPCTPLSELRLPLAQRAAGRPPTLGRGAGGGGAGVVGLEGQ